MVLDLLRIGLGITLEPFPPRKPPGWLAGLDRLSPWTIAGLAAFLQPWALVAAGAATVLEAKLATHQDQVVILVCLLLGFWLAGKSIYLLVA